MLHKMHRSNHKPDGYIHPRVEGVYKHTGYINNTKFYKGFKIHKNKNCAISITYCNPFAFKILIN